MLVSVYVIPFPPFAFSNKFGPIKYLMFVLGLTPVGVYQIKGHICH